MNNRESAAFSYKFEKAETTDSTKTMLWVIDYATKLNSVKISQCETLTVSDYTIKQSDGVTAYTGNVATIVSGSPD